GQAGRLFVVFGVPAVAFFAVVLGAGAIAPAGLFSRLVLLPGLTLGQVDVHGDAGAGGTGGGLGIFGLVALHAECGEDVERLPRGLSLGLRRRSLARGVLLRFVLGRLAAGGGRLLGL